MLAVIRSTALRWQELERLIDQLHRLVQANAQIDAITTSGVQSTMMLARAARLDREVASLKQSTAKEIGAITADLLRAELRRQKKEKAHADAD